MGVDLFVLQEASARNRQHSRRNRLEGRWRRMPRSSCLPDHGFLSLLGIAGQRRGSSTRGSPRRAKLQESVDESLFILPGTEIPRALTGEQLLHRPVTLINCLVGLGGRSCIGIGNCDTAKGSTCNFTRSLTLTPIWVPKRVLLVCVSMRPAIYGDRIDVPRRIKTAGAQYTSKLAADNSS